MAKVVSKLSIRELKSTLNSNTFNPKKGQCIIIDKLGADGNWYRYSGIAGQPLECKLLKTK